ncbi:MAG: hypothetical protein ABI981_08730 [Betaproteobacteria bacterium]
MEGFLSTATEGETRIVPERLPHSGCYQPDATLAILTLDIPDVERTLLKVTDISNSAGWSLADTKPADPIDFPWRLCNRDGRRAEEPQRGSSDAQWNNDKGLLVGCGVGMTA